MLISHRLAQLSMRDLSLEAFSCDTRSDPLNYDVRDFGCATPYTQIVYTPCICSLAQSHRTPPPAQTVRKLNKSDSPRAIFLDVVPQLQEFGPDDVGSFVNLLDRRSWIKAAHNDKLAKVLDSFVQSKVALAIGRNSLN